MTPLNRYRVEIRIPNAPWRARTVFDAEADIGWRRRALLAALLLAALPLAVAPALAGAQGVVADASAAALDLDALADSVRVEAGVPALGLAVVRPGAEPGMAVAGVRCAGSDAEVGLDDLWHWGSITKSMTATLTARLVERDVVSWSTTVGELLVDSVQEMRQEYRDVELRHLLSHHGGLQANIPVVRFAEFGQESEEPMADRLRWVRIALAQEPVGRKEETFEYSNDGYLVAAAMLESATGTSWETLIRREVFEPLGMDGAGFGAPVARYPDQPCGHVPGSDDEHRPVRIGGDNPAPLGPAGRVHMPLADMARYLAAHASRPEAFLSAESWRTLHTVPFSGNYALGWVAVAPEARWHNGSNTMWYAEVTFAFDGRAAAVVVNDGEIEAVAPALRALLGRLMESAR